MATQDLAVLATYKEQPLTKVGNLPQLPSIKLLLYALSLDQHEQTKLIADVSTITTVFFKAHKKKKKNKFEKVIQVIAHGQGHAHQLKSIYSMLTQCGGCGLFNVLTNEVQHLGSSSPTSLLKSLLDICI